MSRMQENYRAKSPPDWSDGWSVSNNGHPGVTTCFSPGIFTFNYIFTLQSLVLYCVCIYVAYIHIYFILYFIFYFVYFTATTNFPLGINKVSISLSYHPPWGLAPLYFGSYRRPWPETLHCAHISGKYMKYWAILIAHVSDPQSPSLTPHAPHENSIILHRKLCKIYSFLIKVCSFSPSKYMLYYPNV